MTFSWDWSALPGIFGAIAGALIVWLWWDWRVALVFLAGAVIGSLKIHGLTWGG